MSPYEACKIAVERLFVILEPPVIEEAMCTVKTPLRYPDGLHIWVEVLKDRISGLYIVSDDMEGYLRAAKLKGSQLYVKRALNICEDVHPELRFRLGRFTAQSGQENLHKVVWNVAEAVWICFSENLQDTNDDS